MAKRSVGVKSSSRLFDFGSERKVVLSPRLHTSGKNSLYGGFSPRNNRNDKTLCQYCGVSYVSYSETRSLQNTVKEQAEKLSHYEAMKKENSRLKAALENSKETYSANADKKAQEYQKLEKEKLALANQLVELQKELSVLRENQDGSSYSNNSSPRRIRHKEPNDRESTLMKENLSLKEQLTLMESTLNKVLEYTKTTPTSSITYEKGDCNGERNLQQEVINSKIDEQEAKALKREKKDKRKKNSVMSVETHDLQRQVTFLRDKLCTLNEEHSNCTPMHTFLRQNLDKLKVENAKLHEKVNCLKARLDERIIMCSNLEAKVECLQDDNLRLKNEEQELTNQLRLTKEELLSKARDPRLTEKLQQRIHELQEQFEVQRKQIERLINEFELKLSESQSEIAMERERADSCLAVSLSERETLEKKWAERWDRNQASIDEQLNALKANHEQALRSGKEHEISLMKELKTLKEKFDKSKDGWESYRQTLEYQVNAWKGKYEKKQEDLENTRKAKIDVELIFQEKTKELETLHEMVREGCEERQELQKKVEHLEEALEDKQNQENNVRRFVVTPNQTKILSTKVGEEIVRIAKMSMLSSPECHSSVSDLSNSISYSTLPSTSPSHVSFGNLSGSNALPTTPGTFYPSSSGEMNNSNSTSSISTVRFTVGHGKKQRRGSGSGSGKNKTSN